MFQNHHTHLNYQTLVIFATVYFNVLGFFLGIIRLKNLVMNICFICDFILRKI